MTAPPRTTSPFTASLDGPRRHTLKWTAHPDDVLPLWVAEMDVTPAPPVVEAVTQAMERGATGYPAAGDDYPRALAAFAAERWGWSFDPSRARLVADVMQGSMHVLDLLTAPGDAVVVTPPVYGPFFAFTEMRGRTLVHAPLDERGRLDPDTLASAFARATVDGRRAALLLCNPHNPTGIAHTRSELEQVAPLARAHGVRVVSDEIHGPLVRPGATYTSWLDVDGGEDGFALLSASKAWNLAGLKAAVAVAGPAAVDELATLPEVVGHGPSALGILAHTVALESGRDWLDEVVAGIDRNHDLLAELVTEHLPDVDLLPVEATYLAWLDFRRTGLGDDPAAALLERGRVALSGGTFFGPGGDGFARLNVATTPELLREGVRRIAGVVAG
ncbi:MalY/PatB family protein [Salsipaludibacter albus]|uniref:MalY/PatB family protein n=1 Tax=Salsipaludibacter albus TaxID=2849650 RepID=UPI001EE3C67A|nr:aminotransferase class I/II-fold pyridoxal phosphate-dependent enzyme [Salsipaludibacter albus]MBY5164383.1 aminotransferase class I/II-fold pyridoxal phosphate-dependent enzyme [Salsipaludibacter albus]